MAERAAYSLLELNQYIRRVISLNFDQPVWIECEIGQASFSRGHWYLDLIEKNGEGIVAQCQAAMWASIYHYIKRKSPVPPEDILRQGMSVKLKVNVDYHERYGLKLIIEDIDSSFTIGLLEMQRQAILRQIRERDLIRKNADTHLPSVVQRLAVISSDKAAGWKDFEKHIADNVFGYDIGIDLYESAMQGQQVEVEMLSCFDLIERNIDHYDAVAVIRGGGARTDLAAFDNISLAQRIALFPIPVLIGIGHEIDQSVLDLVAYRSLKTPTALAEFIISHNAEFESRLGELMKWIENESFDRIHVEQQRLYDLEQDIRHAIRARLRLESNKIDHLKDKYRQATGNAIRLHQNKLEFIASKLSLIDPDKVLARGYTITSLEGKTITSVTQAKTGSRIQTSFRDGSIKSIVE